MHQPEDEAIYADAYIDSLLSRPVTLSAVGKPAELPLDGALERAIDALARLPRFHPSFAFEEALASRLRHAADGPVGGVADVIRLPVGAPAVHGFAGIDRRLIVGGAIASGVSIAGIAGAIAWRQRLALLRGPR
jgi:hypothetical protein